MEARHYTNRDLRLKPDVPGARFWSVALDKAMLTLFEVEPHARFEKHRHASEQITLVLSGALVFELGGRSHVVRAGEVMAIPGGVPHAVRALEEPVVAVDAWSPVRNRYRRG
jgi:quercetin dioxygenase-like cupin family protein